MEEEGRGGGGNGAYSSGNLSVAKAMSSEVFPTAESPTTTSFTRWASDNDYSEHGGLSELVELPHTKRTRRASQRNAARNEDEHHQHRAR